MARTFKQFSELVYDSLDGHARRKGYSEGGPDGPNALYEFETAIGASPAHAMGEIIYKATEYLHEAREVLLIKIAAWAFLEWKYFQNRKGSLR